MAERRLLIDTDIFILLAASGLLARVAELLGFDLDQLRRLPALKNQLTRGHKFLEKYDEKTRCEALLWARDVPMLTESPAEPGGLDRLAEAGDIDEGDAVMYAVLAERRSWLLTSGDKRAMKTLARDINLADIRDAVAGRVVCLETVVRLLLEKADTREVTGAFNQVRHLNKTLGVVFSRGVETPRRQCIETVDSYLEELQEFVGSDFLFLPE